MDKIIILIILLLLPFFVNSQNGSSFYETKQNLTKSVEVEINGIIHPDSVVTYNFVGPVDSSCVKKEITRYDKSTQTKQIEYWNFESYINDWRINMYSIEKKNNVTIQARFEWDKTTESYVPKDKVEQIFVSPNLFKTSYFSNVYNFEKNKIEYLVELSRTERWRNRHNKDSVTIQLKRSSAPVEFKNYEKTIFLYDTFQHKIEESTYQWSDSVWNLHYQIISKYDSTGNCIQQDSYDHRYYFMTGTRYINTYDSLNNLTHYTEMVYLDSQFINRSNSSRKYDEQKRIIQEIKQEWDTDSNRWINEIKLVYEFEDNKEIRGVFSHKTNIYRWIPIFGWQNIYESFIIYNEFGMNIEKQSKEYNTYSQSWNNFSKEKVIWDIERKLRLLQINESKDSEEEDWKIISKTYYYYDGVNVIQDIRESEFTGLSVYPNPVSRILTVTQETPEELVFDIFNMTGKLLLNEISNKTEIPFDLSELNTGQYILRIRKGNEVYLKKIIKTNW